MKPSFVFNPLVLLIQQCDGAQRPPAAAQDPATKTVAPLRLPGGKRASSPSRNPPGGHLGSDYSLFELETFFTRWAPDSEAVAPSDGPSCSFAAGRSTDGGRAGVMAVDPETPPLQDSALSALGIGQRPAFSSAAHVPPPGAQGGGNIAVPVRFLVTVTELCFFVVASSLLWRSS